MKKSILLLFAFLLFLFPGCGKQQAGNATESTQTTAEDASLVVIEDYISQEQALETYQLTLPAEYAESFADATFYICQRTSSGQYFPIYISENVLRSGNDLTFAHNGKIVYARDDYFSNCLMPAVTELESRGDKTHYRLFWRLGKYVPLDDGSQEYVVEDYYMHLLCNRVTGEIENYALVPYGESFTEDLFTGTPQNIDFSQQRMFVFVGNYLTPVYNDAGTLLPTRQWSGAESTQLWNSTRYWDVCRGLHFFYGRAAAIQLPTNYSTELVCFFEVNDKNGGGFCSEPQVLPLLEAESPAAKELEVDVQWDHGNRVLLLEENGLQFYLRKDFTDQEFWGDSFISYGTIGYALDIYNANTTEVWLMAEDFCWNHQYTVSDSKSFIIDPQSWCSRFDSSAISFGPAAAYGEMDLITNLSFRISSPSSTGTYVSPVKFNIAISGYPSLKPVVFYTQTPFLEAFAQEQLLFEEDGISLRLMNEGSLISKDQLTYIVRMENTTDTPRQIIIYGQTVNGIFSSAMHTYTLSPHSVQFAEISSIYNSALKKAGITSVAEVQTLVGIKQADGTIANKALPVTLSQSGTWDGTPPQGTTLLAEKGICVEQLAVEELYGQTTWRLVITNTTGQYIRLKLTEGTSLDQNGQPSSKQVTGFSTVVAPDATTVMEISGSDYGISGTLVAIDDASYDELFTFSQPLVLMTPPTEP